MTDKIVVLSACGSAAEAEKVARALVEQRLAACVNVVPGVRSIYRWKGAVEQASEWLLVIKTSRGLFDRVREAIVRRHSYDLPEAVALPIQNGSEEYLSWLGNEVRPPDE